MNSTRLVSILQGIHSSPIQCTIREIDLDCPTSYCALSYVWGNASRDCKILMDQKEMFIPQNLYIALRHLRSHDKTGTFWIDAICINQLDAAEKSAQVPKMQEIYRRSNEILIWLGPEGDGSASAIALAARIAAYWSNQGLNIGDAESEFRKKSRADLSTLLDQCNCKFDSAPVAAFTLLLARDWFERVWIIQEAAAPVNMKTIQCGSSQIDWWSLIAAAKFLSHATIRPDLKDYFPNIESVSLVSMRGLFNLDQLQRKIETGTYRIDLLGTLANYRHYKATDPRDKVYALLGLATEASTQDFRPDYSLDLPDVYLKVAEHCILHQGSLECFGYWETSSRDQELPSWVPDWRIPGVRHPLAVFSRHRSDLVDAGLDAERIYSASADQTFQKNHRFLILQKRKLVIEGFRIGTVVTVGLPFLLDSVKCSSSDVIRSWEPNNLEEIYGPTGETMFEAFSRTIVADVAKKGRLRERGYRINWNVWRTLEDYLQPPSEPHLRTEWGSLLFATVGRSCVWSDRGFLCLAPSETQPGDWICVLLGGHVIYVLRSVEGSLYFVGECYVHGFMDGQAMDFLKNETCKLQKFVID
jgi:hypothetical protein